MALALFVGIAVVAIVLCIAGVAVLRESARMEQEPPTRPFDFEDAVAWVVRHIPDDVAATLTLDDVHRIIDLQLDYFRRKGVSRNGQTAKPRGSVVVGGSETVDYIMERATEAGVAYTAAQVHAVIDTQLTYLRSIGAIGERAEDELPPEARGDGPDDGPDDDVPPWVSR